MLDGLRSLRLQWHVIKNVRFSNELSMSSPEQQPEQDDKTLLFLLGGFVGVVVFGLLCLILVESIRVGVWGFLTYGEEKTSTSLLVQRWGVVAAAVGGAIIAIWRAVVADRANRISRVAHDREIERLNFDRFQRGTAGLGDDKMSVRLASIIALRDLALMPGSSSADQICDLLAVFAEDQTTAFFGLDKVKFKPRDERRYNPSEHVAAAPKDIVEAVKAAIAIAVATNKTTLSFRNVCLDHADLSNIRINNSEFINCGFVNTNFGYSNISTCAFRMCIIIDAYSETNLTFSNCKFEYCNMSGVFFTNSRFDRCFVSNCSMERSFFPNTTFCYTEFKEVDISGSEIGHSDIVASGTRTGLFCWSDFVPRGIHAHLRRHITIRQRQMTAATDPTLPEFNINNHPAISWKDFLETSGYQDADKADREHLREELRREPSAEELTKFKGES